jgi:hypothetical protein
MRRSGCKNGGSERGTAKADAWLAQGVHSILTLLENALDHTFDTLELYCLRYVFGLTHAQARLITLPHHRGLDLRAPDARAEAAREREKERERVRRKARKSRAREEETEMLDESAMKESERLDAKERSLRRRVNAVSRGEGGRGEPSRGRGGGRAGRGRCGRKGR